jgi:hypothetical protein
MLNGYTVSPTRLSGHRAIVLNQGGGQFSAVLLASGKMPGIKFAPNESDASEPEITESGKTVKACS